MNRADEATIHAAELDAWRRDILRLVLPGGGCALVLSWLALWFDEQRDQAARFQYFLLLGGLLAVAGPVVSRFPGKASWAFLVVLLAPTFHAILALGWAPGVVAILIFVSTFAGILIGRVASYFVVASAVSMFFFGGLIADGRIVVLGLATLPDVPPALDIRQFSNWVRITLIFSFFTAASGWGIGRLFQLLEQSANYYSNQVALLHERHRLLSATQLERSEKTKQLQEAQRFQMVTQLGQGFNQLFGETLSALRRALAESSQAPPDRLAQLSNQMISVVQSTASRSQDVLALLRPHRRTAGNVNLAHSLAEIVHRFRAQLSPDISVEVDAPLVEHVSSSEEWLEQILVNLLLNAERALRQRKGCIVVQLRSLELTRSYPSSCGTLRPGTYAVVRVQDDGPGISRETALRAFEPFYSEWGPPHLGVGLTTVFEMSRKAGGSVEIETPAHGASIAVYIPVGDPNPDAAVSTRSHIPTAPPCSDWKDDSLRYAAKCAALCTALAMLATEVQRWILTNGMWSHLTIGTPLLCVYVVVARSKSSYTHRLCLLVGAVCAASLAFIAKVGFMAPAGIAGLSLSIMFTWALGSQRVSLSCLAFAIVGLLGLGVIHSHGLVATPAQQTSLASAGNWYRVAVSLPSITLIGSILVLNLVGTARSHVRQLAALQSTLSNTEQRLFEELQVVSHIDRITARTSELESLSRMTGAVAHDINNSLQAVTSWASLLTIPSREHAQDTHEALAAIESAISHAEALLTDLDVSRLHPELDTVTDLAQETHRTARLLRVLLTSKHQLVIDAKGPALVRTNPHTYQRALFNLVSNARDAMNQPGTCTVHIQPQQSTVTVSVEDEGCGMEEATLLRLFDPYFTTKTSTGHGLGLFSVASLTADARGSIRTWSEPGKGTRITLTFPRASPV